MAYRWLLDQNISPRVAAVLNALGRDATPVSELLDPRERDERIIELALSEFDVLLTKDLFRQPEERGIALKAMSDSLRIVRIRSRSQQPNDPLEQSRALLWRLREIESTFADRPEVRLVTLAGDDYRARFTLPPTLGPTGGPIGGAA